MMTIARRTEVICMPGGRPKKEIDKTEFEKLCALQCTYTEICAWFDVTDKTLNAWCNREYGMNFSDIFAIKRERGKVSLRRAQFRLAEKNAAMGIWLGKQYLDQKDSVEYEDKEAITRLDAILNGIVNKAKSETE